MKFEKEYDSPMYLESPTLKELTDILNKLYEDLEDHGQVYVAEVCERVGLEEQAIDWSWGWRSFDGLTTQKVLGNWKVSLPNPIFLGDIDGPRSYVFISTDGYRRDILNKKLVVPILDEMHTIPFTFYWEDDARATEATFEALKSHKKCTTMTLKDVEELSKSKEEFELRMSGMPEFETYRIYTDGFFYKQYPKSWKLSQYSLSELFDAEFRRKADTNLVPDYEELYWYIRVSGDGKISYQSEIWTEDSDDLTRFEMGNYFISRETAIANHNVKAKLISMKNAFKKCDLLKSKLKLEYPVNIKLDISSENFRIICAVESDAEKLLQHVLELNARVGVVSVGNLYDLIGEDTRTSNYSVGWTNLPGIHIRKDCVSGKWILYFPRTMDLKSK